MCFYQFQSNPEPDLEVVVCSGNGKNGALSVLQVWLSHTVKGIPMYLYVYGTVLEVFVDSPLHPCMYCTRMFA